MTDALDSRARFAEPPTGSAEAGASLEDSRVVRAVQEYLAALEAGHRPDRQEFLARHADIAAVLAGCLAGLEFVQSAASQLQAPASHALTEADVQPAGPLGDFRIVREVGRGGMGIVYEAEQVSLGRRVALKVLPFAAALDPKQLQRFKNEAQAAAGLHHQHIVPVYAVGCERGMHFYAMQYIDGQTLAQVIASCRSRTAPIADSRKQVVRAPEAEPTGPYACEAALESAIRDRQWAMATPTAVALSTERAAASPAYFRTAARLCGQAAEALEHAHQLGVIHRDIKPANLLVDGRGNLWVTDFGLAHCQNQQGLTMTGDLVGTLRYMSPEQALAKRVVIDHRTDIYSLGATLYELLTLQPAFPGRDRQELLRQIAFEEPRPPRRLNKAVPPELETIVLKALEKNPAERYATAQELADDLQRWSRDEPIRARRPTLFQRARKWSRRHKPVAVALAVGLAVMLILAVAAGIWYQARRAETERDVTAALVQADAFLVEGDEQTDQPERWHATAKLARSALEKARALLAAGVGTQGLAAQVEERQRAVDEAVEDSWLLVELDRIRLDQAAARREFFDRARSSGLYRQALGAYGVDPGAPDAAAARVAGSRIRDQLLAALGDWSRQTPHPDERQRLAHVIQAAEPPNALMARWRAATQRGDRAELVKMAQDPSVRVLPAAALLNLAQDLREAKAWGAAERLLQGALERKPGDFWLNFELGTVLLAQGRRRAGQASAHLRVALALRSDCQPVYVSLGLALGRAGDLAGAIRCFQTALDMDPNSAIAHCDLANALWARKDLEAAVRHCQAAIRIDRNSPAAAVAHCTLGNVLSDKKDFDGALREYLAALAITPGVPLFHYNLGEARADRNDLAGAIQEFRAALKIDPDCAPARYDLGNALRRTGDREGAIREYRAALDIDPTFMKAQRALANVLRETGQMDQAIVAYRQAIRLEDTPESHNGLALALRATGQVDLAIAEYREAIRLKKDFAQAHCNLGFALERKGLLDEAVAAYRKALAIEEDYVLARVNLGAALRSKGRLDDAIAEFRKAVGYDGQDALARVNLGNALAEKGQFRQAVEQLRLGDRLGRRNPRWPHPSGQWLHVAERLAALDDKLPAILSGAAQPANAAEQIELAELCGRYRQLPAAAARLCAAAFAAQPALADDPRTGARYNAACAAALAGCGRGKDARGLDAEARAALRRQARAWLRADLGAWRQLLGQFPDQAGPAVRQVTQHWRQDADLAGVRGDALAGLPEPERRDWQNLWHEVADLEQRAVDLKPHE